VIELLAAAAALVDPILDGRCGDHVGIAQTMAVDGGATAYVRQTKDHVWLCFAVPEGSYGTLDLRIEAPHLRQALNLHASAQLGEWAADDPRATPKDGSSEIWWRGIDGWWGSVTPFNGMATTAKGPRINFRTVRGRELQLSKRRFGLGEWKMAATISDVAVPGREPISVRWPQAGNYKLKVE
jgi:hypothetical protein